MNKLLSSLLVAASFGSSAFAVTLPKADTTWEHISDSDKVTVYKKEIPGSAVVAFRGETTIDAPIAKVANVLIDTSRKKEWVFRIVEAKDVRTISQYERIEYNHTASGFFLVKDRDFVFHAKAELDRDNKQVVFSMKSVDDAAMPEKGPVRGWLDDSRYILTQVAPNQTHVVVEIHADPRGSVAKWLVNLFQKSWPTKSLNGIRAQCAKPDVAEHAGIKAYFEAPTVAKTQTAPAITKASAVAKKKPVMTKAAPGALK
ncbi:MAG: hypothetical protein HY075_00920 [Deltaproteobacteria bacterium]|nr:hypothetical protein [Deltaproteobacteria bacterium]